MPQTLAEPDLTPARGVGTPAGNPSEAPGWGDRVAGLLAELKLSIGGLADRMDSQAKERWQILQAIYPVSVPARSAQVAASGALTISDPQQLGPVTGQAWDVRRISVYGLASDSESVNIYKVPGSAGATGAVAQNYVATITGPAGTYGPGLGAFLLRPHESIVVVGASLTESEWVTVSADAIAVQEQWLGAYLL